MLAATACHSPNTQMTLGGCSPGMGVSHSSANSLDPFGSFADIAFESFDSEMGNDFKRNGAKDPFADYEFIPNITVSAETNSCSDLPPSRFDFGTPRVSMFLSDTMNTSGKENDLDDTKISAIDSVIDYHRRLSVSMEEINLSHESRDEGKSTTIIETIKHSHHNYHKSNLNISSVSVKETADKTTMKSSLYNTFAAIEEMMVSPLKSFHEKVRKKLKNMSSPILQQKYDIFQESPASGGSPAAGQESKTSNSDSVEEEEEEMMLPTGPRREEDDSNAMNNTLVFIDEVSNEQSGPDRLWKREDEIYGCSVTGATDDQLVTPRTPWHSPIRDLRSPLGHDQEGLPNISWSSPAISEIFCSPEPTSAFGKRNRFLCRIYVPSWLVWRPKLFAFVCEFERGAGLNSCVDLLLEEPNPEEHWHVVRSRDITPPEVGEERVIHVPRGMVWVRTSRSGFLTTKARLRDIAQRRPLPCTWRAVTGKSKLVRVLNPRERNVNI